LVELLVALAIGSFLIAGAVTVYSRSRSTFDVNEQNARLQETARFVLATLEPEVQLAGLYGFSNQPSDFEFRGPTNAFVANTQQGDPALPGVPLALHACGANFAFDLLATIQGSNDGAWPYACAALGGGNVAGADSLTVRRADTVATAADATRLQIQSNRIAANFQTMFIASAPPDTIIPGEREVRDLIVRTFYVANNSVTAPGVPALRLKSLAPGPTFNDQELIRGVEDLQVEFGIDPGADINPADGIPDDRAGDGLVDFVSANTRRFVEPDDPAVVAGQVSAVRLWVRVRSETPEQGFVNTTRYQYGTVDFTPNDNFRRVLVSRTVYLRNARSD
jgi:type IV pilus assembly protein PilW